MKFYRKGQNMRKILSLALVIAMLASMVVVNVTADAVMQSAAPSNTVSKWDGESRSDHLAGSGTAEDPYLVQSAEDLAFLAYDINNLKEGQILKKETGRYVGKYIVQTVDIDLDNKEWTPIGTDCDYGTFCGVYDGRGHSITNMKIAERHGLSHGLFGYLGDSGSQVDLRTVCGITNLTVSGEITRANNRVGGLVGQIHNRGHKTAGSMAYITNVTCNVNINLTGYTAIGDDVDNKHYFGGVAGISNFAVFENVVNNGNINIINCDSSHPVGGLIGRATRTEIISGVNNGTIRLETNVLNTTWNGTSSFDQLLSGTLRAGGVVGQYMKIDDGDYLIFRDCVNTGNVTATENGSDERVHAGGILGSLTYLCNTAGAQDYDLVFDGCVNTGTVTAKRTGESGETNAGGILGTTYHGRGGDSTNASGITFSDCANTGNIVSDPNTGFAGGITGVIHVQSTDMVFENCVTSGSSAMGFSTSVSDAVKNELQSGCTTNNSGKAEEMLKDTQDAISTSIIEIGGFPTWGMAGLGTADSPYRIRNLKDLLTFAKLVNSAADVNSTDANLKRRFENVYVVQEANITVTGKWTPIAKDPANSFLGVYDGQGYSVSGLTSFVDGLSSIGFFGYIGKADANTTLRYDCGVANLTVNGSVNKGASYIGGIVGKINDETYVDNEQIAYLINTVADFDISVSGYGSDAIWGGVVGYASSAVFEHVENKSTINVTGATNCNIPTGGIAGRAEHVDMVGCKNSGSISFVTSKNDGTLYVGGLVGQIYKKNYAQEQNFIHCINTGSVTGQKEGGNMLMVGGIVGGPLWGLNDNNNPTWEDSNVRWRDYRTVFSYCVNTGKVSALKPGLTGDGNMNAAGILGSTYPGNKDANNGGFEFIGCANLGAIDATNTTRAAGITQAIWTDSAYEYGLLIEGCATNVSSYGNRIVFSNSYEGNVNPIKTNYQNEAGPANNIQNRANASYIPSSIDINNFPTGVEDNNVDDGYVSAFLLGTGTKEDPFLIRNAADLRYFSELSNGGDSKKGNVNFEGNYIVQTADINLGGTTNWVPIGKESGNSFLGVYDGKGHTISGLYINAKDSNNSFAFGLFGYIGNKKHVCGVANLTIEGQIVKGNNRVGGLAGQTNDRYHTDGVDKLVYITNVVCDVDITITDHTEVGGGDSGTETDNRHYFGGVVGNANGTVFENVVNNGTITVTNAFADHPVGGLVGRALNTDFISCSNEGNVTVRTNFWKATVKSNNVEGVVRAGGIVGLYLKRLASDWISFENCVNNGAVTAEVTVVDGAQRVHAGGILGSLIYTASKVTYAGTSATYSDYNIVVDGCINGGAISATNAGPGEANAGGIIGTLYQGRGTGSANNAGNIKVRECVNTGSVYANDSGRTGRAAGIVGCLYTDAKYTYDVEIVGCMTGTGNNTNKEIIIWVSPDVGVTIPGGIVQNCTTNTATATNLSAWNTSLMAPSLENINGMPTAANVAIVRGLENTYVDLNKGASPVSDKLIILNEAGERVTILDKPGRYQYVLVFHGAQVYMADTTELYYDITCDAQFAASAGVNIIIQDDTFKTDVTKSARTALNTYTEYGKTGAYRTRFFVERILPQQFAEPIYTIFSYGGHEVYRHEYALAIYALNILDATAASVKKTAEQKAALDALLVNLFRYAEEAQKLRWMPEPYATAYLSDAQLAKGVNATKEELTGRILSLTYDEAYANKYYPFNTNEIFVWKGAKLSYDHNVIIRIELSKKPENLEGYRVEAQIVRKNSGGEVIQTYTVKKCGFNDTYVYIEGFTPLNYDCEIIVDIYDSNDEKAAMTVHYSVNTYIYNRWSADAYSPLVQALAHFSKAARAYVALMTQ